VQTTSTVFIVRVNTDELYPYAQVFLNAYILEEGYGGAGSKRSAGGGGAAHGGARKAAGATGEEAGR
jgi:hypothetical protein